MKTEKRIPDLTTTITDEEYDFIKFVINCHHSDISVRKQRGLRYSRRLLKSLIKKGVYEYDGFDPDNCATENIIKHGVNYMIAINNKHKELIAKENEQAE